MAWDSTAWIGADAKSLENLSEEFEPLIGRLGGIIDGVESTSRVARTALQAQGMGPFDLALQRWRADLQELRGQLTNLNQTTQDAAGTYHRSDSSTHDIGMDFAASINGKI